MESQNKIQRKLKCISCDKIIKNDQIAFCSLNCRSQHQEINRKVIINKIKKLKLTTKNVSKISKKLSLARGTVRYYIKKYNL